MKYRIENKEYVQLLRFIQQFLTCNIKIISLIITLTLCQLNISLCMLYDVIFD